MSHNEKNKLKWSLKGKASKVIGELKQDSFVCIHYNPLSFLCKINKMSLGEGGRKRENETPFYT